MSNNLFIPTVSASMTFEEAACVLQGAELGPSELQAVRFLCRQGWKPAPPVDPAKHPIRAAALFLKTDKGDLRKYLGYLHVGGGWLEASDGHVMIRIESGLEPGWYDAKGTRVDPPENDHWPNFERVVPRDTGEQVFFSEAVIESLDVMGGYKLVALLALPGGRVATFDARLFDRLRRVCSSSAEVHMDGERTLSLVARGVGFTAMVMGVIV